MAIIMIIHCLACCQDAGIFGGGLDRGMLAIRDLRFSVPE